MQCPACRAVYSNGLDQCPRCKTPALKSSPAETAEPLELTSEDVETPSPLNVETTSNVAESAPVAAESVKTEQASVVASTLIEFPGARSMPQWRKQLSERVREIQERRLREAARDAEVAAERRAMQPAAEQSAPPLGLVPTPEVPEMNPIVVAALRRIERARQPVPSTTVSRSRGGAAAAARVFEEQFQEEIESAHLESLPEMEQAPAVRPAEAPREHNLVVVAPAAVTTKEETVARPQAKRVIEGVVDDAMLAEMETLRPEAAAFSGEYDDHAPVVSRLTACMVDLLVVVFASSPFAAVIELTNGNWSDPRVAASMGAIVLVVMFLYLTASTTLAGRTWGMSLLSLRAVDAETGLQPTTKQAVWRTLLFMMSLASLGLGILYALFDAEGRTAHDHLSSTVVVRE